MKKIDVAIGGQYYANVTGKKVVVRIEAENQSGGWDATNLSTGKKIRIKSAQRLHGVARKPSSAEPKDTRVQKKPRKASATKADKELSCVGATLKVLSECGQPMNAKEMIEAMRDAGYWSSPDGKTPHATLYSAILRELKKGDQSRFVKVERGRFTARS